MLLVPLAGLVLLAAVACGDPGTLPTSSAGETEFPLLPGGSTATVPASSSQDPTDPAILVTKPPANDGPDRLCPVPSDELDASFVADLGLPAGAQVAPNARYRETWRLRNASGCTWPEGIELVFISGDPIPGPQRAPVSQVGPGRDVDISVELTAPVQPATYASYWRLQAPGGQLFGAVIYAEIVVSSEAIVPVTIPDTAPRPTVTLLPVTPAGTRTVPVVSVPPPTRPSTTPPTPTATAGEELPCSTLDSRFRPVVRQAGILGIDLPCATSGTTDETGIVQVFWQEIDRADPSVRLRSFVIVREATQTLYVLQGKDTATYQAEARAFEDGWSTTMPDKAEACAPLVPPPGYTMPVRSVGRLWCEQSLWNSIGWPVAEAEVVTLVAQGDRNKLLLQISDEGTPTQLLAIDLDARAATVYQVP